MRLYSVHTLLRQREFTGTFEVGPSHYTLSYSPSSAEIAENRLVLRGKLAITGPDKTERSRDGVRATLASSQSGLGAAPPNLASIRARREQSESSRAAAARVAVTESTGPASFAGVLYFHFDPLDGEALGVSADFSRVQLNARLFTIDETARTLHGVFSAIVDTLLGEQRDSSAAAPLVDELNKVFQSK